jgi:RNA polymerase sigma-70 factor (ECF subfamily)
MSTAKISLTPVQLGEYNAFFKKDFTPLTRFVAALGASMAEAEDIAQLAMLDVLPRWARVENPSAYVRTTARHAYWKGLQRDRRAREAELRGRGYITADGAIAVTNHEDQYVLDLLRKLPERQREVMAYTIDAYTPAEIAQELGCPTSTVRSQLRHARNRLQDELNARAQAERREDDDESPKRDGA